MKVPSTLDSPIALAHLRKSCEARQAHGAELQALRYDAELRRLHEHLADREQADQHRHEADAVGQLGHAEGEALDAGREIQADGREQHPEGAGDQVLMPASAPTAPTIDRPNSASAKYSGGPNL